MKQWKCESCGQPKAYLVTAYVHGRYYPKICQSCLGGDGFSSGYQGYDRRRQYEDFAHETVQPYDAAGKPRLEFMRLYPDSARKVFTPDELADLKRQL